VQSSLKEYRTKAYVGQCRAALVVFSPSPTVTQPGQRANRLILPKLFKRRVHRTPCKRESIRKSFENGHLRRQHWGPRTRDKQLAINFWTFAGLITLYFRVAAPRHLSDSAPIWLAAARGRTCRSSGIFDPPNSRDVGCGDGLCGSLAAGAAAWARTVRSPRIVSIFSCMSRYLLHLVVNRPSPTTGCSFTVFRPPFRRRFAIPWARSAVRLLRTRTARAGPTRRRGSRLSESAPCRPGGCR